MLPPEHLSLRVPFSTVQVLVYTYFCNDSSYSSWLSAQSVYTIMWLYIFINFHIHCGIPAFFSLSQLWGRLKASYSIVKDGKGFLRRCFLRLFCSSSFSPSLVTLSPCHLVLLVTLSSLVSLFKDISSQFSRQTSLSLKRCSARKAFGGLDSWKAQKEMK